MATAIKHMERSRRSHRNGIPKQMFANTAMMKKAQKDRAGFFERLMHRTTNK